MASDSDVHGLDHSSPHRPSHRAFHRYDSDDSSRGRSFSVPRKPVPIRQRDTLSVGSRVTIGTDSDSVSNGQPPSDDEASGVSTPERRLLSVPLQPLGGRSSTPPRVTTKRYTISTPPDPPPRYGILDRLLGTVTFSSWWAEIGACLLCVMALVAIVITMRAVEDKPVPDLPFSLSINALIATFVAISQATTVYIVGEGISQSKWVWFHEPRKLHDFLTWDEASRGPWGALKLIWVLRGRAVIASLGGLILVSALILDPVSQQLIQLYDCYVDVPVVATLPRTNDYDMEYREAMTSSLLSLGVMGLVGAAAVGQFSTTGLAPPFTCSTGNCTFVEPYRSVGYCHQCKDITSNMSMSLRVNPNPVFDRFAINTTGLSNCIWNVKLGPFPKYNEPGDNSYYSLTNSTYDFNYYPSSRNSSNTPYFFSFWDKQLGASTMVWWDNPNTYGTRNCTPQPVGRAYQCLLSPCVHTFQANITNNVVNETTIAREMVFGPPEYLTKRYGNVADLTCAGNQTFPTLRALGYQFNDTARWLAYNVFADPDQGVGQVRAWPIDSPTPEGLAQGLYRQNNRSQWELTPEAVRLIPARCLYQVNYFTPLNLETEWPYFIETAIYPSVDSTNGYTGSGPGLWLYAAGHTTKGAAAYANIDSMWQNISDSMTIYMRTNGNANTSTPARGTTTHYAVCVEVRWTFLAYIGSVTLLLLVFFLSMVITTRAVQTRANNQVSTPTTGDPSGVGRDRTNFYDFKSNALAVLFHGLDEQTLKTLRRVGSTNRVKELGFESVKDKYVLVSTQQGWKLSRVDDHSSPDIVS